MGKKKFTTAALDPKYEIYVVYVGSVSFDTLPSSSPLYIHPSRKSQIAGLITKEAPTKVSAKYLDFADVFLPDLVSKLPKYTRINDQTIKLLNGQQPPYGPIYNLKPVELETLKAYIETNIANGFIRPSKSPDGTLILFERKLDSFFRLCVDYQGLNNFTIKNRYLLPLIGELLNRLRRAKQFSQLNLTSAYHKKKIRKRDKWKTMFKT